VEAVWEEEVKLRGVGFVKEVGFKPGVKETRQCLQRQTRSVFFQDLAQLGMTPGESLLNGLCYLLV